MLCWFCAVQLLNYIERGAIASNGVTGHYEDTACSKLCEDDESLACRNECGYTGYQGEYNLTNAQAGLLSSFFTVGLTIASPVSAHAVKYVHPFTVMGVGQSIFTVALIAAGFCQSWEMLLACRTVLGVSEPSFTVVAPAMIDLIAPAERRGVWMALFYMCLSVGTAVGFLMGMVVQDLDWRWAFRIQAALNAPFAIMLLVARPKHLTWDVLKGNRESVVVDPRDSSRLLEDGERAEHPLAPSHEARLSVSAKVLEPLHVEGQQSLWEDVKQLSTNPRWLLVVAGFSVVMAIAGILSFWGPKAARQVYNLDNADLYFGGVVIVAGIMGTLTGGALLDYHGGGYVTACKLVAGALVSSTVCFTLSFNMPFNDPHLAGFFPFFFVGFYTFAFYFGPATYAILNSVPHKLRAQAMGFAVLVFHVVGDVPSPYYAGLIQDYIKDWRWTMTILMPCLGLGVVFFTIAGLLGRKKYSDLTQVI